MDSSTGNFITHDEKATRLWNLKKMLKSTRIERKEDNKFLELLCLDRIERILVVFTPKAFVSEKGGSIQILSLNLARIQSVSQRVLAYAIVPVPTFEQHLCGIIRSDQAGLLFHFKVFNIALTNGSASCR